MSKIILAISAVFVIGVVVTLFAGFDDAASTARPVAQSYLDNPPTATACSERAWPYYENHCLRDRGQPVGQQAKPVRVVSADRLVAATVHIPIAK